MTLHADALATLRAWEGPSASQEALGARYVAHLEAHPDGLARECRPDHITASTLVLSADRRSVLLTLHAKAQRWFQFGGHCEPGDLSLVGAATREAVEESGLPGLVLDPVPVQLSEHEVPFCRLPAPPHPAQDGESALGIADSTAGTVAEQVVHHLDVRFLAIAPVGATPATSEESLDVRWWPVDALPDPEPEMVELVALAVARAESYSSNSDGGRTWAASDQPSR